MLNKLFLKIVKFLSKRKLSVDQMNELSVYIMDNLGNLPIYDIIYLNEDNQLFINGKIVDDIEKMMQLREHARTALSNIALKIIKDQVAFTAIANGIHKAETPQALLFNRAAIWYHQQLENHLKILAQQSDQDNG